MKKLDMRNSVYGLTVSGGRLINNAPDGQTGIAQAAQIKKAIKRAEKISMISEGVRIGDMMSDMS
jgi:hypothetical protein